MMRKYDRWILTPNCREFERLCRAAGVSPAPQTISSSSHPQTASTSMLNNADTSPDSTFHRLNQLAVALNHPQIVLKGSQDLITDGKTPLMMCTHSGCPRRVGGQGDILSGCLSTFTAWAPTQLQQAAYAGCMLTRESSRRAFELQKRAMLTSDVLKQLGPSFEALFEDQ